MNAPDREKFEAWGIVEVLGHQTFPGLVTEQVVAGAAFVRVDVPATEDAPAFTKLIGPGSIYAITPVSEEVARAAASRVRPKPISVYIPEIRPPAATMRALHDPLGSYEPDPNDDYDARDHAEE